MAYSHVFTTGKPHTCPARDALDSVVLKVLKHLKERSFQVSNSCDLLISLAYAYIVLPNSPFFFVCSASDPAFDSLLCSAVAQELHQEDGNSAMLKLVEGLFHFVPLRHCIGPGPRICNMVLKKIEKVKKAQWQWPQFIQHSRW